MFGFKRFFKAKPVSPGSGGVPWHIYPNGRVPPAAAAPVETLASVYACAALIGDSLGQLPVKLMKDLDTGGADNIATGDTAAFLRGVDFQTLSAMAFEAALGGNGFGILHRNGRGGPESLQYYPASLSTIMRADDGSTWYQFAPVDPTVDEPLLLPASDVVHLKFRPSRKNPLVGVSPLEAISPAFANMAARQGGVDAVFRNVASPKTFLTTDSKITKELAARMKLEWEARYGGPNQGSTAVLGDGFKVATLDQDLVSLQTLDMLNLDLLSVCRAFGIPPPLVGYLADGTRASVAEQNRSYATTCLNPWAKRLGEALGVVLLTPAELRSGLYVQLDIGALVRGHGAELAEAASKMLNSGVISPNEARNWIGLPDVDGGEVLARPVNTQPSYVWLNPPVKVPK